MLIRTNGMDGAVGETICHAPRCLRAPRAAMPSAAFIRSSIGSRFVANPQASRNWGRRSNAKFRGDFRDMQPPADARWRVKIQGSGKLSRSGRSIVVATHPSAHPFFQIRKQNGAASLQSPATREVRNQRSVANCQTLCNAPLGHRRSVRGGPRVTRDTRYLIYLLAERARFELANRIAPMPVFKTGAFNRSATSPAEATAAGAVFCPIGHTHVPPLSFHSNWAADPKPPGVLPSSLPP